MPKGIDGIVMQDEPFAWANIACLYQNMHHYGVLKDMVYKRFGLSQEITGCEIGVRGGITEMVLLGSFPKLKMYAIDIIDDIPNICDDWKSRLTLIIKRSDAAMFDVKDKLDFIFIDGDKSREGVRSDLLNYGPMIKPGGFMCGWKEYQWERVWWNGGYSHPFTENQLSEGVTDVFPKERINLEKELLWYVNF